MHKIIDILLSKVEMPPGGADKITDGYQAVFGGQAFPAHAREARLYGRDNLFEHVLDVITELPHLRFKVIRNGEVADQFFDYLQGSQHDFDITDMV